MKTKVTIAGVDYNINLTRALELGVVERANRPYRVSDLKDGDVFKFKASYNPSDLFCQNVYIYKGGNFMRLAELDTTKPHSALGKGIYFEDNIVCILQGDGTYKEIKD